MLGATPEEGRFGIVAAPELDGHVAASSSRDVPVGTSCGTIQEYVLDGLMGQAGVPPDQVKKEEVKKVPVRFELLMSGKLKAAALPEPFLSLAESSRARSSSPTTPRARTSRRPCSCSRETYLAKPEGAEAVTRLLGVWDEGVARS